MSTHPIHILLFTDTFEVGGTERFILRLCKYLDRSRFRLTVGAFSGDGPLLADVPDDVPVSILPTPATSQPILWPPYMAKLLRFIRSTNPDIVFTNHYLCNVIVGTAARMAGKKLVVGQRGRLTRNRRRDIALNAWADRMATSIIANSNAILDDIRSREKLDEAKAHVVHNGVEPYDFAPLRIRFPELRARFEIPEDAWLLTSVARLQLKKGHEDILRAAALLADKHDNLHIAFAGDGPDRAVLEDLASNLKMAERVHFLGTLEDVRMLLIASDCFVLASHTESFPNALVEAMQAGLPCIATDVGGVTEILKDEDNGLVVPAHHPELLSQAIARFHEDVNFADLMGDHAKRDVTANFTLDGMIRKIEDILFEVAEVKS